MRRHPDDLLRPCRADAVASSQRLQHEVIHRVCSAARTPCRRRQGVPSHQHWEGRIKHLTQEFEAFAVTLMEAMPVKRAGQILGESDTRMWRMLFARVKSAYERSSFGNVVWVGADEMNRRKGHNYLTVFADLMIKRGLFATPGKDASVCAAFAAELLRHNGHPKAIQHVAIDMSAAYAKGVIDNFGNARVVYDKSHVIQNVEKACAKVRKAESHTDAGKRNRLERTRWMRLKNRVN